jgi:hypothetical protein
MSTSGSALLRWPQALIEMGIYGFKYDVSLENCISNVVEHSVSLLILQRTCKCVKDDSKAQANITASEVVDFWSMQC